MSNYQRYRPDSMPPVVKNLIIINVVVFVAQLIFRQNNLTQFLALYPIGYGFQPYQIATHMFTHSTQDIFHIVFNMIVLYMFGKLLENVWGPKRFLLFYFVCGVGAAAAHLLMQYFSGDLSIAVGASGAIMGLAAAFAYLFPNTELYVGILAIPVKAKWMVVAYVAYDLYMGVTGDDNIAHFAHLGGALTGIIMVLIWNRTNKRRFY
jgi:membrane associated rhomboid family serine protease